ncbi:MAG: ATP-dependent helicase HrpB, partial [Pontibacterium sp.]
MTETELPINHVLPELIQALKGHNEVVLEAPPGAGKTTRVPLALLADLALGDQKIIMLEPRRLAVKGAAQRLADSLNEPLGQTVGYRMRLESKVSHNT